jgi:DnaJ-class molecular chaperone
MQKIPADLAIAIQEFQNQLRILKFTLVSQNYYEFFRIARKFESAVLEKNYREIGRQLLPKEEIKPHLSDEIKREILEMYQKVTHAYKTLKVDQARKGYEKVLDMGVAVQPSDDDKRKFSAESAFQRGLISFKNNFHDRAVEHFREAIAINPKEASYHIYLGWSTYSLLAKAKKTDFSPAMESLLKALSLQPDNPLAYQYLSKIAELENKKMLAESYMKKAWTLMRRERADTEAFSQIAGEGDESKSEAENDLIRDLKKDLMSLRDLNHYEILQLDEKATAIEIKKAYLKRAKKYHPDTYGTDLDSDAKSLLDEIMTRYIKAYRTLGNEKDRKSYDLILRLRKIKKD